jgi:putative endonuclease
MTGPTCEYVTGIGGYMYNNRSVGSQFEQIAVQYLIERGYILLERNFQCRTGEIDIIAKEKGYLVFIEVKYRANTVMGLPQEAIDTRKMKKITRTAQYYMLKNHIASDTPCRFDVVIILNQEISLIQDAFEATL